MSITRSEVLSDDSHAQRFRNRWFFWGAVLLGLLLVAYAGWRGLSGDHPTIAEASALTSGAVGFFVCVYLLVANVWLPKVSELRTRSERLGKRLAYLEERAASLERNLPPEADASQE